ncbi:MAG TPA: hypothetical protein VM290_07855 [Gaiellaceae bacterium]|nr:hypothetical protein [Gaiellaceae bacterium]
MRRLSAVGVLVGAAGAAALLRRRSAERRERVDVYFEDGSMLSLEDGAPDAAQLLAHARDALRAARG